MHAYAHKYIHAHTHVCACVYAHTHVSMYVACTHMHKHVHAHTRTTHIIQLPGNDNGLLVEIPSTSHDMLPSYQMLHTAWPYTNNITTSKAPPPPYLSWSSSTNNKCSAKYEMALCSCDVTELIVVVLPVR